MRYLHTMVRVHDIDESLKFYCDLLGMVETDRYESKAGEFTLVYLAAPKDVDSVRETRAPLLELTYNWDGEVYQGGRNFERQMVWGGICTFGLIVRGAIDGHQPARHQPDPRQHRHII